MNSLKRLATAIKNSRRIVVATHCDPDLDGISAALACGYLVKYYKRKKPLLFCHSSIPPRYRFLLGQWRFGKKLPDFDLLIAVDSPEISRIVFGVDDVTLARLKAKTIVNIDHHRSNNSFGYIKIIDDKASSTCEIMYRVFKKLHISINRNTAEIFYCGIYGDTGGFVYPNTTKEALRIASELVGLGVSPNPLVKKINVKTYVGTLLLSDVLNTIEIKQGIGIMHLTQDMLRRNHAKMSDSENFISFCQAINDVRVSVFLREEKSGTRISLRSDGIIDVNKVAKRHGGGGHRLAAGIRVSKDIVAAKKEILRDLLQCLKGKT